MANRVSLLKVIEESMIHLNWLSCIVFLCVYKCDMFYNLKTFVCLPLVNMLKEFYHTQEKRFNRLTEPILCTRSDAWLGEAYYFWYDINDAHFWGSKMKRATKHYEIYNCNIDLDADILDTVFNEEHYLFWIKQIEKAATSIIKKTFIHPTLKEINDYFKEKGVYSDVNGVLFQDISENPVHFLVDKFQYKKRIQLAVYTEEIMHNFAFSIDNVCT